MTKLRFSCHDPKIAEYYEHLFGDRFTAEAAYWPQLTVMEREGVKASWRLAMFHEARLQEHFEYTEREGRRVVSMEVYDRDGLSMVTTVPTLLIPEVEVIDD